MQKIKTLERGFLFFALALYTVSMYKRLCFILVSVFSCVILLPVAVQASEVSAGFVTEPIWFSNQPDIAGETTTISTLINNQDDKAIYGDVVFYDNAIVIGKKSVTVLARSAKVASVPWKVTAGSHSMVAKFENTKQLNDKGTSTDVSNNETNVYRFNVASAESTKIQSAPAGSSTSGDASVSASKSDATKTIAEAKNAAENAFSSFDNFRISTAITIGKSADSSTKEIEQIKATPTSNGSQATQKSSFLKTPFAYLKMIFFKTAHFIFSNMYVFYGLIILIGILIIRYLIRAPR